MTEWEKDEDYARYAAGPGNYKNKPQELEPGQQRVFDALAEVGAAIEALPWDWRHDTVNEFLTKMGWEMNEAAREFVVGVFVVTHQRNIFDRQWSEEQGD